MVAKIAVTADGLEVEEAIKLQANSKGIIIRDQLQITLITITSQSKQKSNTEDDYRRRHQNLPRVLKSLKR